MDTLEAKLEQVHLLGAEGEYASKAIMKGVKSQLECPGCKELIEDPRVLACTHTFCRQCLEKALKRANVGPDGGQITCPDCGAKTEVPNGDLSLLQYNFFVQHIMDLMTYYSCPDPVPLVYCGMCRKDGIEELPPAVARCSTCTTFLCKQCFELHSIDDFTKLHSTMSITERGDSGFFSCLIPDETGIRNCKKHSWKVLTHYCITCSKGVCVRCTKQDHETHAFARVEDLKEDYKLYITELMSRTNRLVRRTENGIRTTQDLMSGIQLLAATQIEEVLRTHDVLACALEGRLCALLQAADTYAPKRKRK